MASDIFLLVYWKQTMRYLDPRKCRTEVKQYTRIHVSCAVYIVILYIATEAQKIWYRLRTTHTETFVFTGQMGPIRLYAYLLAQCRPLWVQV